MRLLRNEGRSLATLTTRDILFTETGGVKIGTLDFLPFYECKCLYRSAGIEKSRMIATSEMSATTLKLIALVSIVERLMRKNRPGYSWSREAHSFSEQLAENYSEHFLDDLLLVCSTSSPLMVCFFC